MNVFVLTSGFDYEGESPVGIYASLELAKRAAEAKSNWLTDGFNAEWGSNRNGDPEFRFGSSYFTVREETVQGYEPDCCESMAKYGRCGA